MQPGGGGVNAEMGNTRLGLELGESGGGEGETLSSIFGMLNLRDMRDTEGEKFLEHRREAEVEL
jgi:hypothetical protein